jgi:hypothetical protein
VLEDADVSGLGLKYLATEAQQVAEVQPAHDQQADQARAPTATGSS